MPRIAGYVSGKIGIDAGHFPILSTIADIFNINSASVRASGRLGAADGGSATQISPSSAMEK